MQIKDRKAILQKVVFELRYNYGFTYLDKCGRTINAIMREQPEWVIKNDTSNPQVGSLVSLRNGCSFNFSSFKYDFSLEMPLGRDHPLSDDELKDFVEQVDLLSRIVHDHLGLKEFNRIGFRAWYLFGCRDKEEAEQWLGSLSCYSISPKLSAAFGGQLESTGVAAVIAGTDRKFRAAFNVVERHAYLDLGEDLLQVRASSLSKEQKKHLQKQELVKRRMRSNPEYAALIDIDAFQEEPLTVDPRDFIETSLQQFSDGLTKAVLN
jgi:hypothetical protein